LQKIRLCWCAQPTFSCKPLFFNPSVHFC
jgi:hypothetical protein